MRSVRGARVLVWAAALLVHAAAGVAHAQAVGVPVLGTIDRLVVNDVTDPWSGGEIVVGGTRVVIPRNFLIDLPANRLTLTDLVLDAPAQCFNQSPSQSGLATEDSCLEGRPGGYATILANRIECGDLVAGDVFIDKSLDTAAGVVTYINHTDGYFRVNGTPGANAGGTMVRINDPTGRHTLQQGLACGTAGNCSADGRFGVDADNYTVTFTTGYPVCIPSTMVGGLRIPANVSDAAGAGDAFCPSTNRGGATVANATRFAPLQVGDRITAGGNFEVINGTRFFSAFRMEVAAALFTRDEPGQPDYVSFAETGWDAPGFDNQRARLLLIGRSTLPDSQIDVYALDKDPRDNTNHERILASTVNNPQFTNQGIGATAGGIWKVVFDVDFIARQDARRAPCATLAAAAPSPMPSNWWNFVQDCLTAGPPLGDFRILSPITREIIAHTRRRVPVTAFARDIQGLETTSSQYLTPIGTPGFPEMDEVDLGRLSAPFNFSGIPWLLDRRLGPGGCGEAGCESTPQPADPFPFEGAAYHPGQQVLDVPEPTRPLTYFTFDNAVASAHLLAWPPAAPACTPGPGGGGGTGGGGGGTPPPAASNDLLLTPAGAPLDFTAAQLLGNDSGTGLTLAAIDPVSSAGGTITGGAGAFTYTPRANFAGADTFSYTVRDTAGATAAATVQVIVTDPVLPTVSITAPAAGATVGGTVTIAASAADNFAIAGVSFFVDGVPLGIADNVAPYTAAWDTTVLAGGSHAVAAQAQDINGNVSNVVTIVVTVSNAPASVVVPGLAGLTQAAAQGAIASASLAVGTISSANSATVPAGRVISQAPPAGASVPPASAVSFVLSLGPASVAVPSVAGLTQSAAAAALAGSQLAVGAVSQASSATVPSGSVIGSTPAAGTFVAPNTAVALLVSSGPGGCTAAPGAPAALAVAVAGRTLTFTWTAPAGAANNAPASYLFEAGLTAGTTVQSLPLSGTGTTFVRSNSPAGTYFVRVRGANACGTGAASNEVRVVVQ